METPKTWIVVASLALAALGICATASAADPRLVNISTRMQVLSGNEVLIGGFVIGGATNKTVVVRARGPSLAPFGITNALANPHLQLVRSSDQQTLAANDDWGSAANAAAIASSGFAPSDSLESAILTSLAPGAYTAIVSGVGSGTGVGIVEVFEVDAPTVPLANISTRGQVLTGNDVMIGGFIVSGDTPQTVMVRARGPSLVEAGIPNAIFNPALRLVRSSDLATLAVNDNWEEAGNSGAIAASGFAPSSYLESAILINLPPGAYTAIVSGTNGVTGVGILEAFALAPYVDTHAPKVDATSPGNTAQHMSVLVPVTVTFSEPMDPATLTSGTFTLTGPNGPVAATVSTSGNTATLTPASRLVTETTYIGTVTTGARDLAGNPLAQNYAFSFTTRIDEPIPQVAGCPAPQAGAQLRNLVWGEVRDVRRESGVVTSYRVPATGLASVALTQGQTAATPPNPATELTVSRCPGVIETNLDSSCRFNTPSPLFAKITANTQQGSGALGCPAWSGEQYYVNVRWTYPDCPIATGCGFSLQWSGG